MKNITDAKCTDISFQISDWVFLKLQPYRHWSLTSQSTHKLSKRFFSPFEILEKTGKVAYRLALPATAQLHDVFHISKLKHCHVDPSIQQLPFLVTFHNDQLIYKPIEILKSRIILQGNNSVGQYLVCWENHSAAEATWATEDDIRRQFPTFHLEDKVAVEGETHVTVKDSKEHGVVTTKGTRKQDTTGVTKIWERQMRSNRVKTNVTKFHNFIM